MASHYRGGELQIINRYLRQKEGDEADAAARRQEALVERATIAAEQQAATAQSADKRSKWALLIAALALAASAMQVVWDMISTGGG